MTANVHSSCVWLVDDDELYQIITRKNLQKTGFPVVPASFYNGKEAFDALLEITQTGEQLPCVIILDLNMPIYDGWDFLQWYSQVGEELRNQISLYICSSSIDPNDHNKARSNPDIKAFVEKPMTTELLEEILLKHKQIRESRTNPQS